MPGLTKENVKISLKDNVLTVSGERKEEVNEKDEQTKFHRKERKFGSFSRAFQLPDDVLAGKGNVKAKFENGILDISVPRTKKPAPENSEISID